MEFGMYGWRSDEGQAFVSRKFNTKSVVESVELDRGSKFKIVEVVEYVNKSKYNGFAEFKEKIEQRRYDSYNGA